MQPDVIWIEVHYPGQPPMLAGFVLLGSDATGRPKVDVSMMRDWTFIPDQENRDVLSGMESFLQSLFAESIESALDWLQQSSNVIRCSDRLRLPAHTSELESLSNSLRRLLLGGTVHSASAG